MKLPEMQYRDIFIRWEKPYLSVATLKLISFEPRENATCHKDHLKRNYKKLILIGIEYMFIQHANKYSLKHLQFVKKILTQKTKKKKKKNVICYLHSRFPTIKSLNKFFIFAHILELNLFTITTTKEVYTV